MNNHDGIRGIPFVTIRITTGDKKNPNASSRGTGFFYNEARKGHNIPLIITNKHVVEDAAWMKFDFALQDSNGERIMGPPETIQAHPQSPVFFHPDPNIDLAAIPLAPLIQALEIQGKKPFILNLGIETLPDAETQESLHVASGILMVGFPNGIMDSQNNLPVVRRGILSTPYAVDYLGKRDFLADIAAFPGSSGSPVFSVSELVKPNKDGGVGFVSSPSIHFIGILYAGPQLTAQGSVVAAPVPTNYLQSRTQVMMHLGYCIKSECISPIIDDVVSYVENEENKP